MRPRAGRRIAAFVGSAYVATAILVFLGLWIAVASFVTRGATTSSQALGLHRAFTAPPFLAGVLLLVLSTTTCAWQRTKAAVHRARLLRGAASASGESLPQHHRIEIACDPALDTEAILTTAEAVLRHLRVPVKRRGATVRAVTPDWWVWGSPVFHWALVALIVVVGLGGLVRSSGQIGLAVGQTKPDLPGSYGLLSAGPLKSWDTTDRRIRLDDFDVSYTFGGVNRGPTPTVSVLDAEGRVVKSQKVYPNHTLKVGSLAIYPADYGLAADVSFIAPNGAELSHSAELLDFSGKARGGTVPVSPLVVEDAETGEPSTVAVSVPLDRTKQGYLGRLPGVVRARVLVSSADGRTLADETLAPGEQALLPSGDYLRLNGVGYYSRLQLVDDPSIPALYLTLVVAMLGLAVATFARQMIVVAWVAETPEGPRLNVRAELWRNVETDRNEIAAELERALGRQEEGARP